MVLSESSKEGYGSKRAVVLMNISKIHSINGSKLYILIFVSEVRLQMTSFILLYDCNFKFISLLVYYKL
jgi:hypothetical protein